MRAIIVLWSSVMLVVAARETAEPVNSPPATAQAVSNGLGERRSTLESVANAQDLILLEKSERSLPPVQAEPDEGVIARKTAEILTKSHYNRQPLDDSVSARFLSRYIDNLDNLKLHFLASDVEEFDRKYRTRLDDLTWEGDTSPAREIFQRFLTRVEQRVEYAATLLATNRFDLGAQERYLLDREKMTYPKDLEEARREWSRYLRYEILQELLTKKDSTTGLVTADDGTSKALTGEIIKTLSKRYARLLKTLKDFEGIDVFQYYLTSLTHVYDPHSDYLDRRSFENFAINMNLSLFGIGAVLQSEDGYCKVRELRPGPAMRSQQIKPGDRIVAVGQGDDTEPVDVVDMKLSKVVELIRGPKGSKVRLSIIPVDATDSSVRREVTLVRDEIKLEDEEAKAKIVDMPVEEGKVRRVGIIDLPSFYASMNLGPRTGRGRAKSTTLDVARLLEKLKQEKVEGVILDLRRNGGGSLEEAINLTGLFIKEGPVVQVRDASGRVLPPDEDTDSGVLYDGPLIVLTSRFSASASEILAGCLQDYGRALVVGDSSTHGKGTVQSLVQLEPMLARVLGGTNTNPGGVKITIRKFYRASGASTQLKGVIPDLVLPSVNNVADIGEASLDDPLPWDTIRSAQFEPENRVAAILEELRRISEQRVAADREFDYVREDIQEYLQHQADKSVSLNLEERLREKAEHEARIEQRKQDRKAHPGPVETVYDISLKEVDRPGLPDPKQLTAADGDGKPPTAGDGSVARAADVEEAEEKTPAVDATLNETKRILLDLIRLSPARSNGLVRSP